MKACMTSEQEYQMARQLHDSIMKKRPLRAVTTLVRKALSYVHRRPYVKLRRRLSEIHQRMGAPIAVKVGANDGVTGDPFGDMFLDDVKWRGVLVEPVPECARKLRARYAGCGRFAIEEVAVSLESGVVPFYSVSETAKLQIPGVPVWYDQLGSFDRSHIVRHLNGRLEPFIVERQVNVDTLEDVLKRHQITTFELLHIDTEGHDLHVLKSFDMHLHTPLTICVEHKHLDSRKRSEMKSLLQSANYHVQTTPADMVCIHREFQRLMHER